MTTAPKRQPIPFGKYLLLDRINIGGMAEVWRAKTFGAGGFERLVAIKRILPNIAEDEEFITMFIDEAKITVQLNHANIAQIYELSQISSSYFIAMEYISGKDMRALFDRCRKRGEPAPIPLTAYLIAMCSEGLDYAHRANDKQGRPMNIVHRDVSPQNALVSYEGEVKVIDFGIAKAAGKATKTQAGILKGKFGYMSPEQIRGLPLDRRSDVFAIGVCLYEMLTGERLFVGDSDFSVLEKVRKVEVLPPSHFNRKIPDALEKIVMKSLAKDVDERYSYASELAEDLRKFLYTSGYSFGRKDLAAFMKATFAEDVEKEKQRLQEYNDVKPPEGMLAAAEMGFGMGQVPQAMGTMANASSVTSMPTMAPPSVAPAQSAQALPQIVRPLPPTLSPVPPPGRSPSLPNMPKLSAAAPAATVGKAEHESTVLADGGFDDQTNPGNDSTRALNVRNRPDLAESATDPGRSAARGMVPNLSGPEPMTQGVGSPMMATRPGPPVLMNDANGLPLNALRRPTNGNMPLPPRMAPPMMVEPQTGNVPAYSTGDTSPQLAALQVSQAKAQVPRAQGGSNKTVLAIAAVGIVVVLTLIGVAVAFKPKPRGLLFIDLPPAVAGKARVNINGAELLEPDGTPIRDWPQVREVPAGGTKVMVTAPGYEVLTETVEVKEGNEYSTLKGALKKKSEPK